MTTAPPRFPRIRPAVPAPDQWLHFLAESYASHRFSNYGPLSLRLEAALTAGFAAEGEHFVVCSSATSGIAAALIAAGITGPVLMPAFTFPATLSAIRMAACEPVLIDADPATWAADAGLLERGFDATGAAGAVLVAPFGIRQDFRTHAAIAAAGGVTLVVDNAAGFGAHTEPLPAAVSAEVFSFHATKPFAIGEGGAIRVRTGHVEALRCALNFGLPPDRPRDSVSWGINGKLSEICAAVGLGALAGYPAAVRDRQAQAGAYARLLAGFNNVDFQTDVTRAPWQFFPCLLPTPAAADLFVSVAREQGLDVSRYYHPLPRPAEQVATASPLTVSASLSERMICLPVYPSVTDEELLVLHTIVRGALAACLTPRA